MKKILENIVQNSSYILNNDTCRHAAVTIPILQHNGEEHILFERRAKGIKQAGEISLPGGTVDDTDTSIMHTAIRETCEELNICEKDINIIGSIGSIVTRINFIIEVFPATFHNLNLAAIHVNHHEVEELIAIPLSYFLHNNPKEFFIESIYNFEDKEIFEYIDFPERYKEKWKRSSSKVYVYNYSESCTIWGVTAEIMFHFINKIKKEIEEK